MKWIMDDLYKKGLSLEYFTVIFLVKEGIEITKESEKD